MGIDLDELERDALAELGNIGVSRASTALGRMLGGDVLMSVPTVEIVPGDRVARGVAPDRPDRLVAVAETLSGAFQGTAILFFAERSSLPLARAALPPDVPEEDATDLEDEALAEVGNIVLNSCLSSMANLLGTGIGTTLPKVLRGTAAGILESCGVDTGPGTAAVLFHVTFHATPHDVVGRIVLALDARSAAGLKSVLGTYIGRILK